MAELNETLKGFWEMYSPQVFGIRTELVNTAAMLFVRASILAHDRVLTTAHVRVLNDNVKKAEEEAIDRAISYLPANPDA